MAVNVWVAGNRSPRLRFISSPRSTGGISHACLPYSHDLFAGGGYNLVELAADRGSFQMHKPSVVVERRVHLGRHLDQPVDRFPLGRRATRNG
jgi:hypothetical protein